MFHKVEVADEKLKKVEEKTEKTAEELTQNDMIDLRQSIILENITDKLNALDDKIGGN